MCPCLLAVGESGRAGSEWAGLAPLPAPPGVGGRVAVQETGTGSSEGWRGEDGRLQESLPQLCPHRWHVLSLILLDLIFTERVCQQPPDRPLSCRRQLAGEVEVPWEQDAVREMLKKPDP